MTLLKNKLLHLFIVRKKKKCNHKFLLQKVIRVLNVYILTKVNYKQIILKFNYLRLKKKNLLLFQKYLSKNSNKMQVNQKLDKIRYEMLIKFIKKRNELFTKHQKKRNRVRKYSKYKITYSKSFESFFYGKKKSINSKINMNFELINSNDNFRNEIRDVLKKSFLAAKQTNKNENVINFLKEKYNFKEWRKKFNRIYYPRQRARKHKLFLIKPSNFIFSSNVKDKPKFKLVNQLKYLEINFDILTSVLVKKPTYNDLKNTNFLLQKKYLLFLTHYFL